MIVMGAAAVFALIDMSLQRRRIGAVQFAIDV